MQTPPISRRRFVALGAAASATLAARTSRAVEAAPPRGYPRRTIDLVREAMVIDMLAPLRIDIDADAYSKPFTPPQIADFRASGITGFHNSFGIGGPTAYDDVLTFLAGWSFAAARDPDVFTVVGTADNLDRAKAKGRVGVIMGVQDADHFRTPADVAFFYKLGQRCSQLTYNSQNLLGSGSTEREDGGVSDYGAAIIKAMSDVGMLIDVSHSADRTTLDAVAIARVPIAFTHANCRALSGHPRAKTDEAIRALGAKGGVMGISGVRMFIKKSDPTDVRDMVDHIDHVVKLTGIEHVGIGSDADLYGYDAMQPDQYAKLKVAYKASYAFRDRIDIDGFRGPTKMYGLTDELIRRGYSNANIRAILGGNFRRLLGATWK